MLKKLRWVALRSFVLGFLFLCLNDPDVRAQTRNRPANQEQSVKIKTDLIQLRAVVTDQKGQVIEVLRQEDFELIENGKPQRLEFFSTERIEGVSTGTTTSTTRPVESFGKPVNAAQPKRTIVFFVDTIHLSPYNIFHVKQTLRKFVNEQMTSSDLVRIQPSAGNLGVFGQLTRDRQVLRAAIEKLGPWSVNLNNSMLTPYIAASILRGNREAILTGVELMKVEDLMLLDQPLPLLEQQLRRKASAILLETTARRTTALASLKAITEQLANAPGQRMIALFSDGFSLAGSGGSPDSNALQPVISRAAKMGVVIYAFDARGLTPIMMDASTVGVASLRNEVDASSIATVSKPDVYLSQSARDLEDGMAALADGTGGEAFFGTNDLSKRLQQALDNNRFYYNLSYYPADEIEPNKFRKISIRIKDHPEYSVRTQKGYLPSELKNSETNAKTLTVPLRLSQAMASPVASTAIGVYVNAEYLQREGDDKVLRVDAHIAGENLNYKLSEAAAQPNSSGFGFDLLVATAIFDEKGKQVFGASDEVKGGLPPEAVAAAKQHGFRSSRRQALPPGIYQIRVGVYEASTDRMGTAAAWIEIPKLSQKSLALSSLILESRPGAESAAANPTKSDESAAGETSDLGLKALRQGDSLIYHLVVYPPHGANGGKGVEEAANELTLQARLIKGDKVLYQGPWEPLSKRSILKDKLGIEIAQKLNLDKISPGIYEMRVLIKGAKEKEDKAIQRATPFVVEP